MWTSVNQSPVINATITYTAQAVIEASTQFTVLLEILGFMRSEWKIDLSLVYFRPNFFQLTHKDASKMSWWEFI